MSAGGSVTRPTPDVDVKHGTGDTAVPAPSSEGKAGLLPPSSPATPLLDVEEVRALLLATIDAHPDNVNPYSRGTCRYTSVDRQSHCLIGQIAADQGWKVPGPYAEDGATIQADRCDWPITREAARLMERAQQQVDADTPPWGEVRESVVSL